MVILVFAIGLAVPWVVGSVMLRLTRPSEASQVGTTARSLVPAAPSGPVLGVASCAAAGCHHANTAPGRKGSEYSTWVAHDPHARAYEALLGGRARGIASLTWPEDPNRGAHPEREPLCLGCHVHPDLHSRPQADRSRVYDGVGCEACHGPARDWVSRHHGGEWARLTPSQKRDLGFVETKNLRVRVEGCVRCHVGEGDRDVNHDLIAAGHPRLRFEASAYLVSYPQHWDPNGDRTRHPDYRARAWLIGQLVSARAALELLAFRAEEAERSKKPWPEFAEYTCAGCHRDLSGKARGANAGVRKPGELPWGDWHFASMGALARQAPVGARAVEVNPLQRMLQRRLPPVREVAREARRLSGILAGWLPAAERAPPSAAKWEVMLHGLADPTAVQEVQHWDGWVQRYLGLRALHGGLNDLDDTFSARRPGLQAALAALREELEWGYPAGADSLYRTPRDFDAEKVARRFAEVVAACQLAADRAPLASPAP